MEVFYSHFHTWAEIFLTFGKKIQLGCQNGVLRVRRKSSGEKFAVDFLKLFLNSNQKIGILAKSFWQSCQNCISRLLMIILKKSPLLGKKFSKSFPTLSTNFPDLGEKVSAGLSKKQSTYPKEYFGVIRIIHPLFENFYWLRCKFRSGLRKLNCTRPYDQFEKQFFHWRQVNFNSVLEFDREKSRLGQ